MRTTLTLFLVTALLFCGNAYAQPTVHGFEHMQVRLPGDTMDVLIKKKKGDELKRKPLLLFVQGSLPRPLIILDEEGKPYGTFPFRADSLLNNYHLVIISKPGIPLIAKRSELDNGFNYVSPGSKRFPVRYVRNNTISNYVRRDQKVLDRLLQQPWADPKKLVVAGHSEGATIAAKLASKDKRVTHLIYSGGNPMGRMMSILEDARAANDSTAGQNFEYWAKIVAHPERDTAALGDSYRTTFEASDPALMADMLALKIPVLVSYGTRDKAVHGCDQLHLLTIMQHRDNFHFKAYNGLEHNYFPVDKNGVPDQNVFNWDKVVLDWNDWLSGAKQRMHHVE